MQEGVPASAVRPERLTMEHPWPFSASQRSRELGSSVSSNPPRRFPVKGLCWVCKDTKMEMPEGRDFSKVLGCQRDEHHQMALKEKLKEINIVSRWEIRLSNRLGSRWGRSQSRDNSALELLALWARFQGTYQERLTWMGTNELMTQIQEQVRP